mmetsp:Transcript_25097/g.29561  ORF Transcript_25097/g.29561 Transcript_25097/m.29561 type:complete len:169 (-) Transcript_25097:302-808(-)
MTSSPTRIANANDVALNPDISSPLNRVIRVSLGLRSATPIPIYAKITTKGIVKSNAPPPPGAKTITKKNATNNHTERITNDAVNSTTPDEPHCTTKIDRVTLATTTVQPKWKWKGKRRNQYSASFILVKSPPTPCRLGLVRLVRLVWGRCMPRTKSWLSLRERRERRV